MKTKTIFSEELHENIEGGLDRWKEIESNRATRRTGGRPGRSGAVDAGLMKTIGLLGAETALALNYKSSMDRAYSDLQANLDQASNISDFRLAQASIENWMVIYYCDIAEHSIMYVAYSLGTLVGINFLMPEPSGGGSMVGPG